MEVIIAKPGMVLTLGRLGENETRQFVFEVSDWLDEYPEATIGLVNRLPKADEGYPVVISSPEDGKVSWTITSTELTVEGNGKCELQMVSGTAVKKSAKWNTVVLDALDDSADVPDPWESWETEFTRLKGLAEDAAEAAEAWATGGSSGTPSATNNALYYSEQAAAAQEAAETAQTAAEAAQDAAEDAQDAAETAQTAAETAQGAAEDAQEDAKDSAEDAEAWAVGTRGGEDVGSSDPAYHNNAKYYAENAVQVLSGKTDLTDLAPAYSSSSTYAVGDHVTYDGKYYVCNTAISTAESWTAAHWTETTVGSEASSVNGAINSMNPAATSSDIGKALIVKTVDGGKPETWEYGSTGSGVYVGTSEPTDPGVDVWINPNGASWNDEMIDEIVEEVLEALPTWSGGSY